MTKLDFLNFCEQAFVSNGLELYSECAFCEKLFALSEIMLEANKHMNLTALRDEKSVITRHFADCLLAAKHLPDTGRLLDVGSGGGMPALPFALAKPRLSVTALDATAKKTAYIERTAKELSLPNVSILTGRAEELSVSPLYREKYDFVTARAVAELRVLMEWCIPFLKVGGVFMALKGKNGKTELFAAEHAAKTLGIELISDEELTLHEPDGDNTEENERHILLFRKTRKTEAKYPRRNAIITKSPL